MDSLSCHANPCQHDIGMINGYAPLPCIIYTLGIGSCQSYINRVQHQPFFFLQGIDMTTHFCHYSTQPLGVHLETQIMNLLVILSLSFLRSKSLYTHMNSTPAPILTSSNQKFEMISAGHGDFGLFCHIHMMKQHAMSNMAWQIPKSKHPYLSQSPNQN